MGKSGRTRLGSEARGGPLPSGAKGGLGQHFLKNVAVVRNIVEKAGIKSTDTVLEIGPGNGIMTMELLRAAKKVVAVEVDPRMIAEVQKRVQGTEHEHQLQIIHGDVLKVELPYFDICVANIPYQISSGLVFKLLAHRPFYRCAVIMFQEEFAQRLTAHDMWCRLSVNTQLLAKVQQLMKVSKVNFNPPPKVESRVVRIEPIIPPPPIEFTEWDGMVRLCFSRKNKTLGAIFKQNAILELLSANLRTFYSISNRPWPEPAPDVKQIVADVLARLEFNDKRSSKLDIDDFLLLLKTFLEAGIHFQ